MPNKKAAKKAARQNIKARERNRRDRSTFRTALKKANTAAAGEVTAETKAEIAGALSVIDKTAKKGLIHRHKAARHMSQLMRRLNEIDKGGAA